MMNFYKIFIILLALVTVSNSAYAVNENNNPIAIDSRIKTFIYSNNEVYDVVFNYGYHSYIEFSKGETIKMLAMGDTASWKVRPIGNKLFIMPLEKNGKTNMLIETSKGRSYAFDLICRSENNSNNDKKENDAGYSELRDLAYIVRFYYPKTEEEFELNKIKVPDISIPKSNNVIIKPNSTKHNYTIDNQIEDNKISPVELFDDGKLTYFKFANNNKIIPQIFTYNNSGQKVPCKMLLLQNYVIIKGVHKNLYIQYKNEFINITNKHL
ncbi:P-type conjugative transfer protein VirB9 [Ehrlichia ruminantium]|uniref:P-type conjugative transfer protein VirB9 n=1 Tax=Ehrlichia ruminantium TaxID=779 RepID=UPI0007A0BDAA|nr:P-type conjugative transfer protein VirB9 [Ehrlichia ruminantium]KYW89035.1 P-type conjugative transfer protein VirB9 [Ehrlichia ruminantium]QLK50104.1 P-type conjugative transfer protein VirB9 [Ehrlichia ruminantium]QLK51029.1 P-type conjugative transfer protein VirB9 [Ehrlichia ruminantium]QLK52863.1 P-type conjugative transfer protein VirB9 [Ehrlichia ruminantium]QLK58364.1 P-type conjugative transfer protein VirB9 [Ehrlichia ruminantium]